MDVLECNTNENENEIMCNFSTKKGRKVAHDIILIYICVAFQRIHTDVKQNSIVLRTILFWVGIYQSLFCEKMTEWLLFLCYGFI